ncbi:MAG: hypothetical protein ACLQVI_06530 [Polyangiaceae bacterium]|jgi:hypothetical protein
MIAVLSAIAVAGGLLIGRLVAVRHQRKELPQAGPVPAAQATREPGTEPVLEEGRVVEERVDWSAFPCALGDVIVRSIDGAEAWLGGAIVLREDAAAVVLFIAPDASGERAVYVRPRPSAEIVWLAPVAREAVAVGAEPPSALEIDGTRFERNRRLPLRTQRVGTGAPDVAGTAIVGEYSAASGEVAIVVIAEGVARGWRGRRLREGEFEVWGGGEEREKRKKT